MRVRANNASGGGGGTNKIDVSFSTTYDRQTGSHLVCDLYSDSTGTLEFISGSYGSQWSVNGQTVTKTGGAATTVAYLVQDGKLYIGTPTGSGSTCSYTGKLTSITVPDDSEFELSIAQKTS